MENGYKNYIKNCILNKYNQISIINIILHGDKNTLRLYKFKMKSILAGNSMQRTFQSKLKMH